MKVTVRTIGALCALVGHGAIEVEVPEGGRVEDLLRDLSDTYGSRVASHLAAARDGRVPLSPRVLVNGRDIGVLQGRSTVLADGDDVLILTPMAGG